VGRIDERLASERARDGDRSALKIYVGPLQPKNLAAPQAQENRRRDRSEYIGRSRLRRTDGQDRRHRRMLGLETALENGTCNGIREWKPWGRGVDDGALTLRAKSQAEHKPRVLR